MVNIKLFFQNSKKNLIFEQIFIYFMRLRKTKVFCPSLGGKKIYRPHTDSFPNQHRQKGERMAKKQLI